MKGPYDITWAQWAIQSGIIVGVLVVITAVVYIRERRKR